MIAVSELINNHQKLVTDVACLAAEGSLFQRTPPPSTGVLRYIMKHRSFKLTLELRQITVSSLCITYQTYFKGFFTER